MDESDLRGMFEDFGPIYQINVLRDKITGQSKGRMGGKYAPSPLPSFNMQIRASTVKLTGKEPHALANPSLPLESLFRNPFSSAELTRKGGGTLKGVLSRGIQ